MTRKMQSGFTLIEIAIVLVIIGLILGGVLKGQELIDNAKVKNLANDFRNIPVYLYGYQDRFRATPGDDAAAATHLTGGVVASGSGQTPGNGVIEGNWNSANPADESYLFWQHVRLAGFAAGSTTPGASNYLPVNAMGGAIGIQSNSTTNPPIKTAGGSAVRGSYIICSSGISGKLAKQLDQQLDDGDSGNGAMLAAPVAGYGIGAAAAKTVDDAGVYVVCMGV